MQPSEWSALVAHLTEIETLDGVMGVLGWDEQTYMPKKAAELRGAQLALLSRLHHERTTDARIGRWIELLEGDRATASDPIRSACLRNLGRTYRREKRVPAELVDKLARARSEGFQAWIEAKKNADFARFAPVLQTLLDLSRRRAETIDEKRHPYEVLLEQYDPGTSVESLRSMFARLREGLVPLIEAISAQPQQPELGGGWDETKQWALSREVAAALGYDFDGGRLDPSEHPFSTGQGPGDVRITAHLDANDLLSGLGGTIHETGHALYEQGLPVAHTGTTVREAASYGLHESQSRFWENYVGRSKPFATWLAGVVKKHFPEKAQSPDAIYRASNRVERGLIRVQADEVTYNLHVVIRFEIELALFEGTLAVKDLPSAWNTKYREYLGITPPDDARGVLQDVHWSGAAFGYFPSYTLGNLYAASFGAAMQQAIPDLWARVERGDFAPILAWLREKVHAQGHVLEAPEIVRAAVGDRDHVEDLLAYLWGRQGAIYGVKRT
ncbi:carboxypeptidase M32 [Sandaracinus amylolyticus]|uniref:Metal-dependent carboxypeptidase n=1 Tax=Sandaracinus amylolyticus TaxID=927083 RepID=A0A0F6SH65_9BACT|nr:carboxypeptidase M32 [Sandaracinus amylolyticus]AKF09904.1 Thermostable carboxypeptidase 1 [Sandaracinus amylolyticus]